jgi:hypothetical protein
VHPTPPAFWRSRGARFAFGFILSNRSSRSDKSMGLRNLIRASGLVCRSRSCVRAKVLSELQQAIGNDSVIITDGGGRKSPAWLTIGAWRSAPLGCRVRSAAKTNLRAPPSHLGAIAGEVVHNEPAFPRCKVPGRLKPMAISRCPRRSNGHTAQILFRWGNGVTPTKARSPSSGASALTGRCK